MKGIKPLWHGVDTAKVGYLVSWPQEFRTKLQEFQKLREEAQEAGEHDFPVRASFGEDGYIVRPMGARMLPFAFEGHGLIIFIGNTLAPWGNGKSLTPNMRVEFQPLSVATKGLPHVHAYILDLIKTLGGAYLGDLLSEIHVTCDMETDRPHRPSDYHASLDSLWSKVRTRMRTTGQEHEITTSDLRMDCSGLKLKQVNIGKDKKMLRIYDKLLELRTHPDKIFEAFQWDSEKHLLYLGDRTKDNLPDTAVMRVEFQVRRERLIERQISTVEDFLTKAGGLWQHLTEEFVVLIEDDDSNRTRCSTQEWWQMVQSSWRDYPLCELPKREKPLPDMIKYVDQAMGLILAMGARQGTIEDLRLEDVLDLLVTRWEATHPESWREILGAKYEKFQIQWAQIQAKKAADSTTESYKKPVTDAEGSAPSSSKM